MRVLAGLALAGLRHRVGLWLLLALGVALAAGLPVFAAGLRADSAVAAVRTAVDEIPPASRAVLSVTSTTLDGAELRSRRSDHAGRLHLPGSDRCPADHDVPPAGRRRIPVRSRRRRRSSGSGPAGLRPLADVLHADRLRGGRGRAVHHRHRARDGPAGHPIPTRRHRHRHRDVAGRSADRGASAGPRRPAAAGRRSDRTRRIQAARPVRAGHRMDRHAGRQQRGGPRR